MVPALVCKAQEGMEGLSANGSSSSLPNASSTSSPCSSGAGGELKKQAQLLSFRV